ncbi:exodeoxyribonuclease VII small subunit [Candidatus Saccharibacteria bacterium CG10_big_fil_rev_8_21_14_0_10_47_8]|nr:MAG: exodeoxyribonuclease VII small subunit [Candidatus Saccharibacteria bacterium CG10_big_fil_rev_8_21_14_0_10_47_8]
MAANQPKSKKNYRQLSAELSEVLDWFDSEEVDLDEAIVKYQEAMKLIEQMEIYLKTAENKIHKISASFSK